MKVAIDIGSKTYSVDDQQWFARVSRDFNPVHLDVVYSRRAPAGHPIVHGMHFVAVGLEFALREGVIARIGQIKVKFLQTIRVDECVAYHAESRDARGVRISVFADGALCATVDVLDQPIQSSNPILMKGDMPAFQIGPADEIEIRDVEFGKLDNVAGSLAPSDDQSIDPRFPYLLTAVGRPQVLGLFGLSCIVGMLCPGLYSIFSTADLSLCGPVDGPLSARVRSTDARFRLVTQDVSGLGLAGTIGAFMRVPPVTQSPLGVLRTLVRPGEFTGWRALVVGGSRGLGEVAAKLISAGGGDVTLTYAVGQSDALRVVAEIEAGEGAACRARNYDALADDPMVLVRESQPVTHLLYFATTKIGERRKSSIFDKAAFDRYSEIYVAAFARLLDAFRSGQQTGLKVLYPSSSAIEHPPAGFYEYAMAKVAGERLCGFLSDEGRYRFVAPRYPRLLTDQTATIVPAQTGSVNEVVLDSIRALDRD